MSKKMSEEKLNKICEWLIENVFRDPEIMFLCPFAPNSDIDLLDVIASLYNELHLSVKGEYYDYMFHWANKCGADVEEDMFKDIDKDEQGG